jgi:hypothetical protein
VYSTVATGDNGLLHLPIKQSKVESLEVIYKSSGAVAYIKYNRCVLHPIVGPLVPPQVAAVANVTTAVLGDVRSGTKPIVGCMQDLYNGKKLPGNLVCGMQMVYLDKVAALDRASCNEGESIMVDLKGSIRIKSDRYDLGWYIATDGGEALHGKCVVSILEQSSAYSVVATPGSTKIVGRVAWDSDALPQTLDKNDACGDVFIPDGGAGTIEMANLLTKQSIKCIDKNEDGNLDFGICFSYHTKVNDGKCDPAAPVPPNSDTCYCARYDVQQITVLKNDTLAHVCL